MLHSFYFSDQIEYLIRSDLDNGMAEMIVVTSRPPYSFIKLMYNIIIIIL
jgi:hypothetical protein